jgi:Uma2 family endonuclease
MSSVVPATESLPLSITTSDGHKLYEVVGGEVVEKPLMGAFESILASLLQDWMGPFARTNGLGRVVTETLFLLKLSSGQKRRPDLAFVSSQRWPIKRRVPKSEAWEVVPDLAVEVISDTNSANNVQIKMEEYFEAGVLQVWVVYPISSKVYVYESPTIERIVQVGDDLEDGSLLPGFRLPLAVLFEEGSEEASG